jgi:hypothetical protein
MVKVIGDFKVELHKDLIMIKDSKTGELLKGSAVNANDALAKFNSLCAKLEERFKK